MRSCGPQKIDEPPTRELKFYEQTYLKATADEYEYVPRQYAYDYAPPSLMVNWFESKLNEKKCSGCRRKGTTKALRILGGFKESTHDLVRCKAKGCSYNDCKIHLIFKKDTIEEPKAESKPTVDLF